MGRGRGGRKAQGRRTPPGPGGQWRRRGRLWEPASRGAVAAVMARLLLQRSRLRPGEAKALPPPGSGFCLHLPGAASASGSASVPRAVPPPPACRLLPRLHLWAPPPPPAAVQWAKWCWAWHRGWEVRRREGWVRRWRSRQSTGVGHSGAAEPGWLWACVREPQDGGRGAMATASHPGTGGLDRSGEPARVLPRASVEAAGTWDCEISLPLPPKCFG
uniref:Bm11740 n=1 Tax=Brugia malayi TaxID=6279 RepID=A0A1I9GA67_BRUMA|nr:Bm11740 [Brugia malayi]